ncbi:TonB-dependent receptor [Neotamlana laminarinivorans]|uniref:TonB-dependent receptor n=1 Tax=Neotamlana laminarinivorans TaxID=2883124 RepID=A0A9X1L282_9FLAO|nr:TonB-dependent receptor [Tamlana laminarinivorans]MCB4799530.1 TonB-dependent receptor [Tamlana laminarinivorans]
MRKHIKHILTVVILLTTTIVLSQSRTSDTLNTGVIDVVKPYAPTISDAFKVKETPKLDDATTETKKEVKYNIFSFPVASTFTPAKGKAAVVEKREPEKIFDNYASLGVGTYTTILGEVYLNHALNRNESVGGYVSHHSSQGGIEGVEFDDHFLNSKVNVNYTNRSRDYSWGVDGGFQYQIYNWYGVTEDQVAIAQANNPVVDHSFYNAHFGGDITFEDTYIKSLDFKFRRFGDNQGSGENRFVLNGAVDVPINDIEISTKLTFDYLGGSFDTDYFGINNLNYGNFFVGLSPTYELKRDDLTLNLGVSTYYLNDTENGDNKFYLYPNVTVTYRLVNDVLIVYGGVQGDLQQNSYYDFANENPFVSPTLYVQPTDALYNAFVGLKGKLSSNMSYSISGHYQADKSRALFKTNTINNVTATEAYQYGNSFGIAYDNVDSYGVAGELNVDVNRNFTLGIKAEYFAYDTTTEEEAWNLPDIKGSLFLDYQIDQNWFAGANLFYVGERKDQLELESTATPETVTLDSFFDANVHVGYHINDKFSVYAKGNNLVNNTYQKWQNYQVQGIQVLAGATYKFDF